MTSPEPPDQAPQQPQPTYQPPMHPYAAWQPPRRGVPGWATALIAFGTGVAGLLVGAVLPWLFIGFAFTATDFDDYDSPDDAYFVADSAVTDAIEEPCSDLEELADELPLFGPSDSSRAALQKIADQHRAIADAIDGAARGDDARLMADDWRSVATALDSFRQELESDPVARLDMPAKDGEPVSHRIYYGNDTCYVPSIVESFDPDLEDDFS